MALGSGQHRLSDVMVSRRSIFLVVVMDSAMLLAPAAVVLDICKDLLCIGSVCPVTARYADERISTCAGSRLTVSVFSFHLVVARLAPPPPELELRCRSWQGLIFNNKRAAPHLFFFAALFAH
jgi:hypothetical protein